MAAGAHFRRHQVVRRELLGARWAVPRLLSRLGRFVKGFLDCLDGDPEVGEGAGGERVGNRGPIVAQTSENGVPDPGGPGATDHRETAWLSVIDLDRLHSSTGSAPARQAGGHWFEPSTAHRKLLQINSCDAR
jgi:hypothetical protein